MPTPVLLRALLGLLVSSLISGAFAQTITVQHGDSLWGLARKHGTDVATLRELNSLASDTLKVGQTLLLSREEPAAAPDLTVTVRPGDTLYEIALANGVNIEDLIAYNGLDGTLIHPGQVLQLAAGENAPAPIEVSLAAGDSLWSLARRFDTTVEKIAAANNIDPSAVLNVGTQLVIPSRYDASGAHVGGPAPVEVVVQRGDTLWAIAQRYDSNVSALMSVNSLKSQDLKVGQTLRILPGSEINATRAAEPARVLYSHDGAPMVWPLEGLITSRYGYRQLRVSGTNFHSGLDIDGNTGDPVVAAVAGEVSFAGWRGGYGNLVIVTSGETEYFYAHASELLVREGEQVKVGQLIARVGSTGNSTGPHLHFEIRVNGDTIDPLPVLESTAAR